MFDRTVLTVTLLLAIVPMLWAPVSPMLAALLDPLTADLAIAVDEPLDGQSVQRSPVEVDGTVTAPAGAARVQVTVTINHQDAGIPTWQDDRFSLPGIQLRHGDNFLHLEAKTTIGWRALTATQDVIVTLGPSDLTAPVLDHVPSRVAAPSVLVGGVAQPGATVELTLDGSPAAEATANGTTGRFAQRIDLSVPGRHAIGAAEIAPPSPPGPSSPVFAVVYDPDAAQVAMPLKRRVDVTVHATAIHVDLDVQLPADDPRAVALVARSVQVPEFVRETFGALQIGGNPALWWFRGVGAAVSVAHGTMEAVVHSNPELEPTQVLHSIDVQVPDADYLQSAADTLNLHVPDYRISSASPEPTTLSANAATWRGPAALPDDGIVAKLDLDVAGRPAVLLGLRPGDVLHFPGTLLVLLELVEAVMNGLALVWYLWLRRRYQDLAWSGTAADRGVDRLMRVLIGLCFVTPLIDAVRTAAPTLRGFRPVSPFPGYADVLVLATLLSGAGIATAVAATVRPRPARALWFWAWEYVRGVVLALWLVAAIWGLVALWGHTGRQVDPRVVAMVATAPMLAAVSVAALHVAAGALWPRVAAFLREPAGRVVTGIVAAAAAALCWPVATLQSQPAPNEDGIAWVVATAYYQIQYYAGYAVLIGVLGALKSGGDSRRRRNRRTALGVLVFANFVVVVDPYFFGLPLSFVLWLVLLLTVVLARGEARHVLDDAAPTVVEHRAALLAEQAGAPAAPSPSGTDLAGLWRRIRPGKAERERGRALAALPAHARERPLAFGPTGDRWSDGLLAAGLGLGLIIPWLAVSYAVFATRPGAYETPVLPLTVAFDVAGSVLAWLVIAFLFGYFFSDIRGRSGSRKGLLFSGIATLCVLPAWAASLESNAAALQTAILVCVNVLYVTAIGVIFDLRTAWAGLRDRFGLLAFARLSGLGSLGAFSSLLLASAGGALTTALTGGLVNLVAVAVHATGVPTLPPQH